MKKIFFRKESIYDAITIFISVWFDCFRSVILVQRKFRAKFKKRVDAPTNKTILNIHRKAFEDGELENQQRPGRTRTVATRERLKELRASVSLEPQTSVRRRSRELQASKTSGN